MADFDNRIVRGTAAIADTVDAGLRAHMLRVYNYMVGALALTGGVAYLVANSPALLNIFYHETLTANGAHNDRLVPRLSRGSHSTGAQSRSPRKATFRRHPPANARRR